MLRSDQLLIKKTFTLKPVFVSNLSFCGQKCYWHENERRNVEKYMFLKKEVAFRCDHVRCVRITGSLPGRITAPDVSSSSLTSDTTLGRATPLSQEELDTEASPTAAPLAALT